MTMKTKYLSKKLGLNKSTVSNLSSEELSSIFGGTGTRTCYCPTYYTNCLITHAQTYCFCLSITCHTQTA